MSESKDPFEKADFLRSTNVSRETFIKLQTYAASLAQAQKTLNLVSKNSLPDLWRRHMLDSFQLKNYLPKSCKSITDIGTGAGFPGLVLAISTGLPTRLIDSHARKGQFLRRVINLTNAPAEVITERVEVLETESDRISVDILTARALAPLDQLCEMADFLGAQTCLFLKGRRWKEELTRAEKHWTMTLETFRSCTSDEGRILRITNLKSL